MFFVFAYVDIAWDARSLPVPRGVHGHLCEHAATGAGRGGEIDQLDTEDDRAATARLTRP